MQAPQNNTESVFLKQEKDTLLTKRGPFSQALSKPFVAFFIFSFKHNGTLKKLESYKRTVSLESVLTLPWAVGARPVTQSGICLKGSG